MPEVEAIERLDSRVSSTGPNPYEERHYTVRNTDIYTEARQKLIEDAPLTVDPWGSGLLWLPRSSIDVFPVGYELWEGLVLYRVVPLEGESSYSFDTSGGETHIKFSRKTIAAYDSDGAFEPNTKKLINITATGVDGVDITTPTFKFSETHYKSNHFIVPIYKRRLFLLTGTVNNAEFKNFRAGEVLFLGVVGHKRGAYGDWELTFEFACQTNIVPEDEFEVGDIPIPNKDGWDYLWCMTRNQVIAGVMLQVPTAAYIERVYRRENFALLEI